MNSCSPSEGFDVIRKEVNMSGSEAVKRGSQKLIAQLSQKGESITVEDVRAALNVSNEVQFKLLRWHVRGLPPAEIELNASLQVSQQHLGEVVQRIVNTKDLAAGIEIFPYGIPVPDIAVVNFTNVPPEVGG
jgi:hypothetical protein